MMNHGSFKQHTDELVKFKSLCAKNKLIDSSIDDEMCSRFVLRGFYVLIKMFC